MKHLSKLFLCIAVALSTFDTQAAVSFDTPFVNRSQTINAALELVGWQKYINRCDDSPYGVFTVTPYWQQTFQADTITRSLFGETSLTFSGSRVADRNPKDLLADYFGLPMDYNETVNFSPRIQNFAIDFNFYFGLPWDFYVRAHAPLVYTRWNLRESIAPLGDKGQQGHPEGYFASGPILRSLMNADILEALKGTKAVGDLQKLEFGKINGEQEITKFSDIEFAIGWNFISGDFHLGFNVRAAAPIRNAPTSEFLFEPIVGDYNRWNVGAGLTMHASIWSDDCYCENISAYLDFNITHVASTVMKRTFDLKNKTGSRYMPVLELGTTVTNLEVPSGTAATRQYTGTIKHLSSISTVDADVSASAQVDAVIKFAYTRGGLGVDLGYEFWARSKEEINDTPKLTSANFALKGDAQIYGFGTGGNVAVGVPHAIVVSQSGATLFSPQLTAGGLPNTTDAVAAAVKFTNANADTPALATDGAAALNQVTVANGNSTPAITITAAQINGSQTPVLVGNSDIDTASGLADSSISHKIFAHVNYAWKEICDVDPFIGFGGSAEFAQHRGVRDNDKICKKASSASQWSVWIKGGIAF